MNIPDTSIRLADGSKYLEFSALARPTARRYFYPRTQKAFRFLNVGVTPITLTIKTNNYTVNGGANLNVVADIDDFTVQASELTGFFICSWSYDTSTDGGGGDNPYSKLVFDSISNAIIAALKEKGVNTTIDALATLKTSMTNNGVLVFDSFNRADSASIDSPDIGAYTVNSGGNWGISGNKALGTGYTSPITRYLYDVSTPNCTVIATLVNNTGSGSALIGRFTSTANHIKFHAVASGSYRLTKRVTGSDTVLATFGTVAPNDVLKITMSGDTINCFVNGVLLASVTESFNNTATAHGIGLVAGGEGSLFDNLRIEV